MSAQLLTQVLVLLFASVVVVAVARRQGLPPILGYLVVGLLLGPLAFGLLPAGPATRALAEIGVVFLLFTLGLDFSWPRMVAMRREVFGLGLAQVLVVGLAGAGVLRMLDVGWAAAAHRAVGAQSHTRPPGLCGAAVPGPRRRAPAGARHGAGQGRRHFQRREQGESRGRRVAGTGGGVGDRALAPATTVLRDRAQPAARAVHADRAAGGAELRLDYAAGRAVHGTGRVPGGNDARRDRIPAPGRVGGAAVSRAAAGPVFHLGGDAARCAAPVPAIPAGHGARGAAAAQQEPACLAADPLVRRQQLQGPARQPGTRGWRGVRRGVADDSGTPDGAPGRAAQPAAAGGDGPEHGAESAADPL